MVPTFFCRFQQNTSRRRPVASLSDRGCNLFSVRFQQKNYMVVAPYVDVFTPAAAGCSKKRRWFQHLQDPVPAKELLGSSTVPRLFHPTAVADCNKNGRWFQLQRTALPAYCVADCSFPVSEVLALPVEAHRLNGSRTTTIVWDAALTEGNRKLAMVTSAFGCGDH